MVIDKKKLHHDALKSIEGLNKIDLSGNLLKFYLLWSQKGHQDSPQHLAPVFLPTFQPGQQSLENLLTIIQ